MDSRFRGNDNGAGVTREAKIEIGPKGEHSTTTHPRRRDYHIWNRRPWWFTSRVNELAAFQFGKRFDRFPRFLLGKVKVIKTL